MSTMREPQPLLADVDDYKPTVGLSGIIDNNVNEGQDLLNSWTLLAQAPDQKYD
jgi:hypothetical protein